MSWSNFMLTQHKVDFTARFRKHIYFGNAAKTCKRFFIFQCRQDNLFRMGKYLDQILQFSGDKILLNSFHLSPSVDETLTHITRRHISYWLSESYPIKPTWFNFNITRNRTLILCISSALWVKGNHSVEKNVTLHVWKPHKKSTIPHNF